jgi:hypothetical protein
MPYLFCENTDCRYHEEFAYSLRTPVGETFKQEYIELAVGMDGKERPFPQETARRD